MTYVLAAVAVVLVIGFWQVRKAWKQAYLAASEEIDRKYEFERNTMESAPWFGKTGLEEADERELPRYLRREFGEFVGDADSLKAADLVYLGVQADEQGSAHWWSIPARCSGVSFAYIDTNERGNAMSFGWGDREPPRSAP